MRKVSELRRRLAKERAWESKYRELHETSGKPSSFYLRAWMRHLGFRRALEWALNDLGLE